MGAGGRTLVVIGASAGGVEALTRVIGELPADLPATVVVVLHVPPSGTSILADILDRHSPLAVMPAKNGSPLVPGRVYVAPPDNHVLVRGGELALDRGPRHNGHRPAVDPLFSSAAREAGERCIGVVLTGTLDDGSVGLGEIKERGGIAVVQDPDDALYPSMPANALERVAVAQVAPLRDMAALLAGLVSAPAAPAAPPPPRSGPPMRGGELDAGPAMREDEAAGLSCPECGGTLWSVGESSTQHFRCRIGHVYSDQSLLEVQGRSLEAALW